MRVRPNSPARVAAIAATLLAIALGVVWTQVVETSGAKPVAWQGVGGLGPVLWPKSVARSFWKREQLVRFLARTFPRDPPAAPPFDFTHRRLILVAAGPRSSTDYRVEIVRVTERRGSIRVLARETTPSLGQRARPGLTSPYRLIAIPATSKRVYISWQGRP